MEPKPEASNGVVAPKQEVLTPGGPKGKFQQGGPNMQKKKNFQNRNEKMDNNMPKNNRGPHRNNEVRPHNLDFRYSVFGRHVLRGS